MPWLEYPMKDVQICDKPRGVDKKRYNSRDFRMGEPNTGNLYCQKWRTRCELKYLSSIGKEIKRDSLSSDERRGRSSNLLYVRAGRCIIGVVGFIYRFPDKI